jgi:hypothetical protein
MTLTRATHDNVGITKKCFSLVRQPAQASPFYPREHPSAFMVNHATCLGLPRKPLGATSEVKIK